MQKRKKYVMIFFNFLLLQSNDCLTAVRSGFRRRLPGDPHPADSVGDLPLSAAAAAANEELPLPIPYPPPRREPLALAGAETTAAAAATPAPPAPAGEDGTMQRLVAFATETTGEARREAATVKEGRKGAGEPGAAAAGRAARGEGRAADAANSLGGGRGAAATAAFVLPDRSRAPLPAEKNSAGMPAGGLTPPRRESCCGCC